MNTVGVDYSLSCPAMCLMDKPDIKHCKFYYLTNVKKDTGTFGNGRINGFPHVEYTTEQERYDDIAEFFLNKIPTDQSPKVYIEDYSFGSKGRVFNLAENCGCFKQKLWEVGYKFDVIPPTVIKKFATGKGNSDKQKMYESFIEETGLDLVKALFPNKKLGSPVTDIIDSYYIAKYGYFCSVEAVKLEK
jgi:hypothetical protein